MLAIYAKLISKSKFVANHALVELQIIFCLDFFIIISQIFRLVTILLG